MKGKKQHIVTVAKKWKYHVKKKKLFLVFMEKGTNSEAKKLKARTDV